MREMVLPPSQNTVGVCKQITLLILYYISSRLVTLLKIIDALKFINFSFQIFLLSVREMSNGFTSYVILDFLHCFGLDPLTTAF
jgi:hypothetical protein